MCMTTDLQNTQSTERYRPCVGMVVVNADNNVLVGQRLDSTTEAWQMPQGGIDDGETSQDAAFRELREEIGTDDVTIITRIDDWLYYDLPEALCHTLWKGQYCGQKQHWFLMRLNGDESAININTAHPEFSSTAWVELDKTPDLAVPFKRAIYRQLVKAFSPYL